MSDQGNPSKLPPLRDVAESLRDGLPFEDICTMYGVVPHTLTNRLYNAGYGQSGHPLRVEARKYGSLDSDQYPVYVAGGVGGGDYLGLPYEKVPYTRKHKEFLGLDWSTSPASGPIWRWV